MTSLHLDLIAIDVSSQASQAEEAMPTEAMPPIATRIVNVALHSSLALEHGSLHMSIFVGHCDCPEKCSQWRTKHECDDFEVKYSLPDCPHGERGASPGDDAVASWHMHKRHWHEEQARDHARSIPIHVEPGYYAALVRGELPAGLREEIISLGAQLSELDGTTFVVVRDPEEVA